MLKSYQRLYNKRKIEKKNKIARTPDTLDFERFLREVCSLFTLTV